MAKENKFSYQFKKECLGMGVITKLPCMRKEREFSIYSETYSHDCYYLQADTCCFKVNKETGEAVYTNKGTMPMDFYLTFRPTKKLTLPMQFVEDIRKAIAGDSRYLADGTIVIDFSKV